MLAEQAGALEYIYLYLRGGLSKEFIARCQVNVKKSCPFIHCPKRVIDLHSYRPLKVSVTIKFLKNPF